MKIKSTFAVPFLVLSVLALMAMANLLDSSMLEWDISPYLSYIIIQLIVFALPSLFFCRMRGDSFTPRLRLRFFGLRHVFVVFSAFVVLVSGSSLINYGISRLFPDAVSSQLGFTASVAGETGVYAVLAVCIFPALLEEFLFRSIVMAEYESVSVPFAVFASALLFALIHLNWQKFPAYFFSGIVLACVVYMTRSVFSSMVIHSCNNIAALLLDQYMQNALSASGVSRVLIVFCLTSIFLVFLILLFWQAQRLYEDYGVSGVASPYVHRSKKKNGVSPTLSAVTTPPFVLLVVLCVIFSLIK